MSSYRAQQQWSEPVKPIETFGCGYTNKSEMIQLDLRTLILTSDPLYIQVNTDAGYLNFACYCTAREATLHHGSTLESEV